MRDPSAARSEGLDQGLPCFPEARETTIIREVQTVNRPRGRSASDGIDQNRRAGPFHELEQGMAGHPHRNHRRASLEPFPEVLNGRQSDGIIPGQAVAEAERANLAGRV